VNERLARQGHILTAIVPGPMKKIKVKTEQQTAWIIRKVDADLIKAATRSKRDLSVQLQAVRSFVKDAQRG
jgi:hypothetical protein